MLSNFLNFLSMICNVKEMRYIWFVMLMFVMSWWSLWNWVHAQHYIAFDTLLRLEQTTSLFPEKQRRRAFALERRRCVMRDAWDDMLLSPWCLLYGKKTFLSMQEAIDILMPYVQDVWAIYDTEAQWFAYMPTDFVFDERISSYEISLKDIDAYLLSTLWQHDVYVRVSKISLALLQLETMSVYASVRDTRGYGPCRKQNYDVALQMLDGVLISPWEQINLNTLIAHHSDYCTGTAGRYMFYQGVCGWSTQLFWNALVNPYLYVVERHAHGEFWENFYGNMWEDASIYETSKQLIIENVGLEELYIRTFWRADGNTVLVSIYPKNEWLVSTIQKEQKQGLHAELTNTITYPEGDILYEQSWESRYWWVNTTKDS